MKTFFKPSNILFYSLSTLMFFFLGMVIAGITGAGKGEGLAGGAIVLGYAMIAGFIAFIASIFSVKFLNETKILLLNKIFGVIVALFIAFFIYRYQTSQDSLDKSPSPKRETTSPVLGNLNFQSNVSIKYTPPMGLGMIKPKFYENRVLYFYGNPNLEKPEYDHAPYDSLVFTHSETGIEITYAPPWFAPTHLKMDYDILLIRVISITHDLVEVMVNEFNGQTTYMNRYKNELLYWPEFLLTINSVEPLSRQNNPIRVKPLTHASQTSTPYSFLKPLKISNQWMQVELLDDNFKSHGKGWIKWQENGELLITYSLLS